MQSLEHVSTTRAPSYHGMTGLSYNELWNSFHSAYHYPIPPSCLSGPLPGEPQQLHELSPATTAATVVASDSSAADVKLSGAESQWGGEFNTNGASKLQVPREGTPPDRRQPATADAAETKDLIGLRPFQPSLTQSRLMMQTQPTTEYDQYSFDPRWGDPKLLHGGERFKIADSDAADTLLSMKRGAVVHQNTAAVKFGGSVQLRGRDAHQASGMVAGLCYGDHEEKPCVEQCVKKSPLRRGNDVLGYDGREIDARDALPWYWRHQEISRILSAAESYDSPATAKELASEPDDFRRMGHYAVEGYPSAGFANSKTTSHCRGGGSGVNSRDFTTNTWYYTRSSGDGLSSDFTGARWNVNAPPSLSLAHQQPFVIAGGAGATPTINRAPNTGGPVAERDRGGSIAHALQQQKKNNSNENNNSSSSSDQSSQNHQCHICGKSCTRPSSLKAHIRCHYGEKPYLCQLCGKTFSQAANLTAHRRIHSGERPFKCVVCDRSFSQSSSVKTHMRTHTGERPYPCTFCSKSFSDSSTLSNHRRIHTGEKPYQCRVCGRPFSQSGNLNRHMRIHHRTGGQSVAR